MSIKRWELENLCDNFYCYNSTILTAPGNFLRKEPGKWQRGEVSQVKSPLVLFEELMVSLRIPTLPPLSKLHPRESPFSQCKHNHQKQRKLHASKELYKGFPLVPLLLPKPFVSKSLPSLKLQQKFQKLGSSKSSLL